MRKYLLAAAGLILCANLATSSAFAYDGYSTQQFHIDAPNGVRILSMSGDKRIRSEELGDTNFTMVGISEKTGTFKIDIGIDNKEHCRLTIKDMDYWPSPVITGSHCSGQLQYVGMEEVGENSYVLQFSSS